MQHLNHTKNPLVVAGPCSAETETQVMQTAEQLAHDGRVNVYRAGLWKPRSEPGCFEGVGKQGLKWLRKVRDELGLAVITEVAREDHVKAALDAGLDWVWIGARSTTNPFTVQEIAEALEGSHIPVMLKNPVSPDPRLWKGAVRRLQNVGIHDITLIHRGFTPFQASPFRNEPLWDIPLKVQSELPDLKIICDPSHIAGRRELVGKISLQAWQMGFDGLMVETHVQPKLALSDARQQINPAQLSALLDELEQADAAPLEGLRQEVDQKDQQLLELIAARMNVVRQIGSVKKDMGLDIVQQERWERVLNQRISRGNQLGLSEAFLEKILEAIHSESISQQRKWCS